MLLNIISIGIGSALGGILRYIITKFIDARFQTQLPLGTFIVNITGCLIIGFIMGLFAPHTNHSNELKLFLTVGFCGGFTTFSTLVNESNALLTNKHFFPAFFYLSLSFLVGILLLRIGYVLALYINK